MQILLLSADQYNVTNEATGEILRGITMFYLNDYREDTAQSLGYKPTKISAPMELWATLQKLEVPCIAELSFITRPGAMGKATAVVNGIEFVRAAPLFA